MTQPSTDPVRPPIYEYLDFRLFLSDMYAYLKQREHRFSYRKFSERAGLGSPTSLKRVIDGDVGLPAKSISKFARGLGLSKKEEHYFFYLAAWNQESDLAQRQKYERKLRNSRRRYQVRSLGTDTFDYLSKWYFIAVREVIGLDNCPETFAEMGQVLTPSISEAEVAEAVETLSRLNLIEQRDGRWHQTSAILATEDDVLGPGVRDHHLMMIKLAERCVEAFEPEQRVLGTVTGAIHSARLVDLRELIHRQRKEVVDFLMSASDEIAKDTIVQINFQAFPLSGRIAGRGEHPGIDNVDGEGSEDD